MWLHWHVESCVTKVEKFSRSVMFICPDVF
jgi:hypothetical protein